MTKSDKFVFGVCAIIFGGCAFKAIKTVKQQKEEQNKSEEESD